MQHLYQLYLDSLGPDVAVHDRVARDLAELQRSPGLGRNAHQRRRYNVFARLIALRLPLPDALLGAPQAPADLLEGLADGPVLDDRGIRAAEAVLARDPCRPDLWLALAMGHLTHGNAARAGQLLRRLAASGFAERTLAQDILGRCVARAYRPDP